MKPEAGGLLDQDSDIQDDVATFGWLMGFAFNIIEREEKERKFAEDALRNFNDR